MHRQDFLYNWSILSLLRGAILQYVFWVTRRGNVCLPGFPLRFVHFWINQDFRSQDGDEEPANLTEPLNCTLQKSDWCHRRIFFLFCPEESHLIFLSVVESDTSPFLLQCQYLIQKKEEEGEKWARMSTYVEHSKQPKSANSSTWTL